MNQKQLLEKELVGSKAAELIEHNMTVGLGTGSTVYYMIKKLAERVKEGLAVTGVSTSRSTTELALSLGINVVDINEVEEIDICIDGADEVDKDLCAIKGGGGALLREKIVASHSKKVVLIIDSTKYVKRLGAFPLPVEIVPYAYKHTLKRFIKEGFTPKIRENNGKLYETDGGNYILDLYLNCIEEPAFLSKTINNIPGVVENGLFIDLADEVYLADGEDVRMIKKAGGN
ncbi:ribose-5-phosphate isomerase RpiA [Paenibacillus sp. GCM10027626]|uniref:ribose-5-phosphate isomerase RpiA n=1 Tax=Paenibacillus sp. GCM10027626 TaxID=3273411 RepID=UPI00362F11E0